jgi:hypothetical protein
VQQNSEQISSFVNSFDHPSQDGVADGSGLDEGSDSKDIEEAQGLASQGQGATPSLCVASCAGEKLHKTRGGIGKRYVSDRQGEARHTGNRLYTASAGGFIDGKARPKIHLGHQGRQGQAGLTRAQLQQA